MPAAMRRTRSSIWIRLKRAREQTNAREMLRLRWKRTRFQRRRLVGKLHGAPHRLASERTGNDGLADRGGILAVQGLLYSGTSGESCALCQSKGVVERDLTPKETYYVFQSYWAKKPMIHIYGHTWPIRWGKPEEMKEILVYSNCPQVELIVNGVPQGIKKRNSQDYPAAGLHWNCKLQAGENTVIALSKGKAVVADTLRFVYETRTWGKPAQLQAKVTHCGGESSGDISMVEVQLTDAKGVPCLDAVNYIEFGLAGDGQLIENQGTSTGSRKVQAYNGRAAIRVDKRKGESVVSVRCDIPEVKTVFVRL